MTRFAQGRCTRSTTWAIPHQHRHQGHGDPECHSRLLAVGGHCFRLPRRQKPAPNRNDMAAAPAIAESLSVTPAMKYAAIPMKTTAHSTLNSREPNISGLYPAGGGGGNGDSLYSPLRPGYNRGMDERRKRFAVLVSVFQISTAIILLASRACTFTSCTSMVVATITAALLARFVQIKT